MISPSNKAMENLVPPTSIARVRFGGMVIAGMRGEDLFARGRAGTFLRDGYGRHQITEAGGLGGRAGYAEGQGGAGGKAVARSADIHGIVGGPGGDPGVAGFLDDQHATGAVGYEHAGGMGVAAQGGKVHVAEDLAASALGLLLVRLDDDVAEQV